MLAQAAAGQCQIPAVVEKSLALSGEKGASGRRNEVWSLQWLGICEVAPASVRAEMVAEETEVVDVEVRNEGSIFIFTPLTEAGREWINLHVEATESQWFAGGLVVEHRYAANLADGMAGDGLVVK